MKPENVLLTADGALKIADFGLATLYPLLNPEEREGDRTYLAPEMWSGTGVGPPADIYRYSHICILDSMETDVT